MLPWGPSPNFINCLIPLECTLLLWYKELYFPRTVGTWHIFSYWVIVSSLCWWSVSKPRYPRVYFVLQIKLIQCDSDAKKTNKYVEGTYVEQSIGVFTQTSHALCQVL